ncbi:glycoside hydrolase family 3 C-terminal domain-containing protein [Demequina sp. TTPB684]|uniref:glycoside hydrolase family 3 C-terminal domain-containing protein n=1 Tax=unclassified Demequina TaxID=2620311 RepID=UPI001CF16E97|nr:MULTISPECIES: glycoside hydrolase family 3 C-terminal domain-containing protein [unclassified Demequina]MCB2413538.1 glycoside hydrolase family 3 C-terminal domain-containing protein [Demequina sp. TTPB684]UPU87241.1 glycoside hydrolase family 3 C-terminal domain-containing protein [Demequina sp. TMPB413]
MAQDLTLLEKAALLSGLNTWQSREFGHAGIRSLFFADGPHGVRRQTGSSDHLGINASQPATCFPTAATVANSWDQALAEQIGEAIGAEAAQQGVDVLLGPGLNIKRSPLCGRSFEYFSEDPFLSGTLAAAYVRGIQSQGVAACPKHFAVNSQESRRMASNSVVDERTLREIYLTAFEIVVRDASPRAIMTSYNRINGTYAHENAHLLSEILRDEWGFAGAVVTDWGGSNDAVAAIEAGGTIEMPSPGLGSAREIVDAVKDGRLDPAMLNARAEEMRALVQGMEPGRARAVDLEEHHQLARRAARESVVLLKNHDAVLPLAKDTRLAVIGDFAATPRYQGAGSSLVNASRVVTALEAWSDAGFDSVNHAQGFRRNGTPDEAVAADALDVAAAADVVLLYMGLDEISESEGIDREHLRLPANQVELLERVSEAAERVVVVLSAGSVVEMPWLDNATAVVHGYLGGQAGAEAMVDILTGAASPSGRLAETYPMVLEDTPTHGRFPARDADAEYREGMFVGYRYYATADVPVRFPFGFGLSYTSFAYDDLRVTETGASLTLTNTGDRAGSEVVQMYVSRQGDGPVHPTAELKGFAKVALEPGESTRVKLPFDDRTFRRFDAEADAWVIDEADYELRIGASVDDTRLRENYRVAGTPAPARRPELAWYAAADVKDVSDEDFAALLGRELPSATGANRDLGVNDPLLAMHRAKSPIARLAATVLRGLIARSERRGKPDLNLLFLYNMPLRAMGKMTLGAVSMPMVHAIVDIVNGHFWRGASGVVRGYFRARRDTKSMKRELAASAQSAAPDLSRSRR